MSPAFFPDIPALFPIFPPDITARHPGRWRKKAPGIPFLNIFYLYVENHLCAQAIARPRREKKAVFPGSGGPGRKKNAPLPCRALPSGLCAACGSARLLFSACRNILSRYCPKQHKKGPCFPQVLPPAAQGAAPGRPVMPPARRSPAPFSQKISAFCRCAAGPAFRKARNPHSGRFYLPVRQVPGISSLFSAFSPFCYIFV